MVINANNRQCPPSLALYQTATTTDYVPPAVMSAFYHNKRNCICTRLGRLRQADELMLYECRKALFQGIAPLQRPSAVFKILEAPQYHSAGLSMKKYASNVATTIDNVGDRNA